MRREHLVAKLKEAHGLASEFRGGYSGEFIGAEEFSEALGKAVDEFENGHDEAAERLWIWFAPTCAWDDFVGDDGVDLGNLIFGELNENRSTYGIKV